jgi:hypothetical protein
MKFAFVAAALAATLAAAGCGSSGGGGSTTGSAGSARDSQVKFSQCMREHGIDFPDPDPQGRILIQAGPGSNLNPDSPQFKSAAKACQKYQPKPSGNFDRANAQKMQAAALKYAQCMRAHGVNFPDPKFEEGGAKMTFGGPGLNPNDPNFKAAASACSKLLPVPKGGPGGSTSQGPAGGGPGKGGMLSLGAGQ